jgi:RNA polymerase sigma-70 factor (ECF subfamily)
MVNLNKYEIRSVPFSAWLYRIAINELNQYFRKNKKARTLNVPLESMEEITNEMDDQNPEEKIKEIISAVSTLPEDEIRVVEMRFFEKKGFREIGNILQITENNAKVRTYRILDKIKKIILKKI